MLQNETASVTIGSLLGLEQQANKHMNTYDIMKNGHN